MLQQQTDEETQEESSSNRDVGARGRRIGDVLSLFGLLVLITVITYFDWKARRWVEPTPTWSEQLAIDNNAEGESYQTVYSKILEYRKVCATYNGHMYLNEQNGENERSYWLALKNRTRIQLHDMGIDAEDARFDYETYPEKTW